MDGPIAALNNDRTMDWINIPSHLLKVFFLCIPPEKIYFQLQLACKAAAPFAHWILVLIMSRDPLVLGKSSISIVAKM